MPGISLAQSLSPADTTAMRLVEQGKVRLAQNEFKEAEEAFRAALKRDENLTAAMAGLGEVEMAKQNSARFRTFTLFYR